MTQPSHSVATLTVSDSRDSHTDASGTCARELLVAAGFVVDTHMIVRDESDLIRNCVNNWIGTPGIHAVVVTGGTGIGPRDVTVEALEPLFEKKLDGFGEAFRRLSWDQVGPRSILSRASAGVVGGRLVFALPGSPKAVRLGVEQIVIPVLQHAMAMLQGQGHHGAHA